MSEQLVCRKCKAPVIPPRRVASLDVFSRLPMTITGFLCQKCGHWTKVKKAAK